MNKINIFSAAEEEGDAGSGFPCPQGGGKSPCATHSSPVNLHPQGQDSPLKRDKAFVLATYFNSFVCI